MDGDGEDRPEEIKQLVDNLNYNSDKPIVKRELRDQRDFFLNFVIFSQNNNFHFYWPVYKVWQLYLFTKINY